MIRRRTKYLGRCNGVGSTSGRGPGTGIRPDITESRGYRVLRESKGVLAAGGTGGGVTRIAAAAGGQNGVCSMKGMRGQSLEGDSGRIRAFARLQRQSRSRGVSAGAGRGSPPGAKESSGRRGPGQAGRQGRWALGRVLPRAVPRWPPQPLPLLQ